MYMKTPFKQESTVLYSSDFPPPVVCTHSRWVSFCLGLLSNSFKPTHRCQSKGVTQNRLWERETKLVLWFCMGSGLIATDRFFLGSCVVL